MTLALRALAWILSDERRAQRLMSLTGLDPDRLRAGLGQPAMLCAVLDFLVDHEPDLLACARALDVAPEQFVAARATLAQGWGAQGRDVQ